MGNKNSKPADVLVTDEYTQSYLPVDEIRKYRGGSCDYAALDVVIANENNDEGSMKPKSINKVLSDASKQNFRLCYVTHKKKDQASNFGKRLVYNEGEDRLSNIETTHTVILNRANISPESMKQLQLEKMDAQKTIINLMMEPSTKFYTCKFSRSIDENVAKTVKLLESFISEEASKGSRLRSIIHNNKEHNQLDVVLVFSVESTESSEQPNNYEYHAEVIKVNYKEKMLKINKKKMSLPHSNRMTNTTCHHEWLDLFKEYASIVDVVSLTDPPKPFNFKGSTLTLGRSKKRKFQVNTIWVYEKNMKKNPKFEGLVRQVWTALDKTLHENIKKETLHFGQFGWNLSTILVTPHIRMKMDGSDHNKCVLFFEREVVTVSPTIVPVETSTAYSTEIPAPKKVVDATENSTSAAVNENESTVRLGMISKDELSQTKLKKVEQSDSQKTPSLNVQPVTTSMISQVQLKKVDFEKIQHEKQKENETPVWLKKKKSDEEIVVPELAEEKVSGTADDQQANESSLEESNNLQSSPELIEKVCKADVVVEADVSTDKEVETEETAKDNIVGDQVNNEVEVNENQVCNEHLSDSIPLVKESDKNIATSTNASKAVSNPIGQNVQVDQSKCENDDLSETKTTKTEENAISDQVEEDASDKEHILEDNELNLEKDDTKLMLDIDSTYDLKLNTIHTNNADTNLLAKREQSIVEGSCEQLDVVSTPITSETFTPNEEAGENEDLASVDGLIVEEISEIATEDRNAELKESFRTEILVHKNSEDEGIDTTSPENEVSASEICEIQSNESVLDKVSTIIMNDIDTSARVNDSENVVQIVNPLDSQMPEEFIELTTANPVDEPTSEELSIISQVESTKLDQVHAEPAAINLLVNSKQPDEQKVENAVSVNSKELAEGSVSTSDEVQSSLTLKESSEVGISAQATSENTIENCVNDDPEFEIPRSSLQLNEKIIVEDEPGEKEIRKKNQVSLFYLLLFNNYILQVKYKKLSHPQI